MSKRLVAVFWLLLIVFIPMLWNAAILSAANLNSDAVNVAVKSDDATSTHLEVEIDRLDIEQVEFDYQTLNRYGLSGEVTTSRAGWPELPIVTRTLIVPPQAEISLQINRIESRIETDFEPYILADQSEVNLPDLPGEPADEYLSYRGFWPSEPIQLGSPAILRGYRLITVKMYPIQYNPQTKETRYNDSFDFELVYQDGNPVNPVLNPDRPRPSSSIYKILESLTLNPPRRDHPTIARGSYLVIYAGVNGVEEAIQPLLDWRARSGWDVHAESVRNNAGTNDVKTIIQDAYDDWPNPPEMVALVGDAGGGVSISAYNQTDLDFTLLDGNDILADVDLGRISIESVNQLRDVVAKIVNYESDPYMEDTDWYTQAMVCAGAQISGLSTILVNRWVRRELLLRGFDNVHEWYYNDPFENHNVPSFFQSEFQRGVSFSNYRGWVGIEGLSQHQIMNFRAHRKYPTVVLLTCSSGNYINTFGWTEAFLRSAGGGNGAVGLCTNNTHVQFNNAVSTGIWIGFLKEDLFTFGTAVNRGRYELWRQYDGFDDNNVRNFSRWTNLMGDPATHVFTNEPRTIVVDHVETIAMGESRVSVTVADEEAEAPMAGATVCLYKADDDFQMLSETDANGRAEFNIPTDALEEGDLLVTVTKHNVAPYLGEIEVSEADFYIGTSDFTIDDDEEGESDGDGDETANPGETVELVAQLTNFGAEVPEGGVNVLFETLSPWVAFPGDSVVEIEQAPEAGESVEAVVVVELNPAVPNGAELQIATTVFQDEETSWNSMLEFEAVSPNFEVRELEFEDEDFGPGVFSELDIIIANNGGKASDSFVLHAVSLDPVISVRDNDVRYAGIEAGEFSAGEDARFRISAHPFTIPGMEVDLKLFFESDAGFRDTTYTSFTVGESGEGTPFGPDDYGYVCFDSEDEGWEMTPVYEWIEIDPDEDDAVFEGELTNLRDTGDNQDESMTVDLPFEFQYYGEVFEELTISTSGWAAFGNWRELSDFRNRRIASGGGPNAQLCVWWDNLTTGRILYFYDEDEGRFIVEWNEMGRLNDGGTRETFQLILYDPQLHPTYSGDGVIVYQYKDVTNSARMARNDTPYCTIGLGNLDDTDGLEYTYWNTYHPGATRIRNELAIKFTTAVEFITGVLTGTITGAATEEPIQGAQIWTTRGFYAETDSTGRYYIDDILIGEGYFLTVTAEGYNDSTFWGEDSLGFDILEDDTLEINIALLHPEFNIDTEGYRFQMNAEDTLGVEFTLSNDGNGPLQFTSRFAYMNDPWNSLLVIGAEDTLEDNKIQGVEWVDDHWVVSGGANGREEENWFYEFDRDGNFIERYPQPIEMSRYGLRDLCCYDNYLYATFPDENQILRIDPETYEALNVWETPGRLRSPSNITIDGEGNFWVSAITNDLYKIELVGDTVLVDLETYEVEDPRMEDSSIRTNGLAWFRDDPDGYNIYIMSQNQPLDQDNPEGGLPDISIFKMNPYADENKIRFVTYIPEFHERSRGRGGICITAKWDTHSYVLAAAIDNSSEGDFIGVLELAPNSSWIDYNPRSGGLEAGENVPVELIINTADLDTAEYSVEIEFNHNAEGLRTLVPVDLIITTLSQPELATIPFEYALEQNFPNPFNPATTISYSLKAAGLTRLTVFDMTGRQIAALIDRRQNPGKYSIVYNAENLPAGLYFFRLESGNFSDVKKMLLVK